MSEEKKKPADDLALAGTVVAGRYKILKRLGTGGMGQVFLVQHVHTDERLALKALLDTVIQDTNALERFRREARTPARIDSDHVVRVTDADAAPELKGSPFLVMEYLKGEDLDAYVKRTGPLAPREVVNFVKQIARVLDKAHALGIIHRDLKPENIFITQREDGSAFLKILDFGIAKFTGGAAHDLVGKTATSPGEIFGTPLYMAPEQARGESEAITSESDIWAVGLLVQKMLSPKEYWTAKTLTALISQIVYEPMKAPSERGAELGPSATPSIAQAYDAWFLKCCAREPKDRFPSAGAAVAALARAFKLPDTDRLVPDAAPSVRVATEPPPSARPTPEKSFSKTDLQLATTGLAPRPIEGGRSWAKVALIVLGALGVVALLWAFVGPRSHSGAHGSVGVMTPDSLRTTAPTEPPAPLVATVVTPTTATMPGSETVAPISSAQVVPSAITSARIPPPIAIARPPARPPATATQPIVKPEATTPPAPVDPLGSRE